MIYRTVPDHDLDVIIRDAYDYVNREAQREEYRLGPLCIKHVHDGNPCNRCGFIKITEPQ